MLEDGASRGDSVSYSVQGSPGKLKLLLGILRNGFLCVVLFGLPLFLPAWTLRFWNAWLFLGMFAIEYTAMLIYFAVTNPEYAAQRLRGDEEQVAQKIVMTLLVFCALGMLVIAGFNYRYHWSRVPVGVVIAASLVMTASFVAVMVVMKQNSYASRVVAIQEDQTLIDTGAYGIVRHPMYAAFSLLFCVVPLVLGSLWSLIPVLCIPVLLTFRIRNEEKVLMKGLKGYEDYVRKVRYRLIPYVW